MIDDENEDSFVADESDDSTTEKEDNNEDKNKKSISADLIRGHINTIILRSLFEGDRYGYDIINEIEQKSHGQYTLKQPTLYSALKRLEAQGYIKSYWGGVSNGGRRRYFSLTDEGRDVVKQNQSEWEYSRTIIDNLISDEEFDFANPAPQRLDFRILRKSTSRTPIVTEEKEYIPIDRPDAPSYTVVLGESEEIDTSRLPYTDATASKAENPAEPQQITPPAQAESLSAPVPDTPEPPAPIQQSIYAQPPQQPVYAQGYAQSASIQQPVYTQPYAQPAPAQAFTPSPQEPERNPLPPLYMQRSAEERNYKDILSKIYRDSIKSNEPFHEPEPSPEIIPDPIPAPSSEPTPEPVSEAEPELTVPEPIVQPEPPKAPVFTEKQPFNPITTERDRTIPKINFSDIRDQAASDGLRVWISGGTAKSKTLPEDYFDKGASLVKASLPIFALCFIELLLVFLFRDKLFASVSLMTSYLIIMLIVALAVPAVCGGLKLAKFQPVCRRLKKLTVIETGCVAFILLFILLLAINLLINVQLTDIPLLMIALIIPGIYLLNIPLFSFVYYFFSRSKL